ncbi:hypothetical protein Cme02nite_49760 [Catellatospora methionotrophica]|uniref:Uncharacterized protein n=1 Tax=Catellatospora methionotrophica TaxID=121620 RepID=A0A8J3LJ91_9ACTN|nr:hypothetical protein Cme02nite_49760 [Catellatospora methionotrophica]
MPPYFAVVAAGLWRYTHTLTVLFGLTRFEMLAGRHPGQDRALRPTASLRPEAGRIVDGTMRVGE